MREAVIVSTARTPIGKAFKGAFNNTQAQELGGHVIASAVQRAGIAGAEVDDVVMGCALQQGATSSNIARQSSLRAGLPTSVSGMSVDRQCASWRRPSHGGVDRNALDRNTVAKALVAPHTGAWIETGVSSK